MFRAYSVSLTGIAVTAAVTEVLAITAGATRSVIITRASLSQQSNTTSFQQAVQILRTSTASTNVSAPLIAPLDQDDAAATLTARGMATTVGTAGNVLVPDSFNWQNGYLYLPEPETRHAVAAGSFLAFKLQVAPPVVTCNAMLTCLEVG